ncbi:MAG: hypothetical protein HRU19_20010 [Pseudobacteriovorax sp.]|nr:hypothetical protein [Pseudobacteriovorax sp.]
MIIFGKIVDVIVAILWFGISHIHSLKRSTIEQLKKLKAGLSSEKQETELMIYTYRLFLSGKASKQEMKIAHAQLRDIMRTVGLGALVIMPFSFLTLPILVKIGEKLGVNVLPSSFRSEKTQQDSTEQNLND